MAKKLPADLARELEKDLEEMGFEEDDPEQDPRFAHLRDKSHQVKWQNRTLKQLQRAYIGKVVSIWKRPFNFYVKIVDVRIHFTILRFLVEPMCGCGEAWVEAWQKVDKTDPEYAIQIANLRKIKGMPKTEDVEAPPNRSPHAHFKNEKEDGGG